jgi:hypothetical protein
MIPTLDSCTKYGERAALLALIPGLGHFRSRQYLVGTVTAATIGIFLLWVFWLAILQFGSHHSNLSMARAYFLLWTFVVWQVSAIHAYLSAIRLRQQNGTRRSVDLAVEIAAADAGQFFETARAKNLSKSGACLLVARELPLNAKLQIEFARKPINRARVIWSKPTGNGTENLIGVEFARPLAASLG